MVTYISFFSNSSYGTLFQLKNALVGEISFLRMDGHDESKKVRIKTGNEWECIRETHTAYLAPHSSVWYARPQFQRGAN